MKSQGVKQAKNTDSIGGRFACWEHFLLKWVARPLVDQGRPASVSGSPTFALPAYIMAPQDGESEVLEDTLDGLRFLAAAERQVIEASAESARCRGGSVMFPSDPEAQGIRKPASAGSTRGQSPAYPIGDAPLNAPVPAPVGRP